MKSRFLFFAIIAIIIVIVGILAYKNLNKKEKQEISEPMTEKTLADKKIAIIVAFKDFQDEEYSIIKNILTAAGAQVSTVSSQMGKAIGAYGGEADVDLLIDDLKVADYDGIVFIGGSGAVKYFDDEACHQIAKEIVSQGKVLGAICIAPAILAKAGVLKGKKATVWSSSLDKSAVKILEENGVIFQNEEVVVDGKIVTGNGPQAAKEFGETIVNLFK